MFAALRFKQLIVTSVFVTLCVHSWPSRAAEEKSPNVNPKDEKSEKMHQRLEQLFTWRVSDRLQFTPEEEQKFSEEFKKLSAEKVKLSQDLDGLMDLIEKAKGNEKEAAKLLASYQSNLKKTSELQLKELQIMKKLFGTKRLVNYVLLKREMTQKFKDVLTQNGSMQVKASSDGGPLKEPEVIQEK